MSGNQHDYLCKKIVKGISYYYYFIYTIILYFILFVKYLNQTRVLYSFITSLSGSTQSSLCSI